MYCYVDLDLVVILLVNFELGHDMSDLGFLELILFTWQCIYDAKKKKMKKIITKINE